MRMLFAALLALLAFGAPLKGWAQSGSLIIDQSRPDRAPAAAVPGPSSPSGSGRVEAAPTAFTPFILREVRVKGSTVSADTVGSASRPYIGRTVDAADLNKIAEAIGAAYAKSDIALYTILTPRQTFAGGVVQMIVIEGRISEVTITSDDPGRDLSLTQAYGERLKAEPVLKRSTLQRYVGLMRDLPGETVDVQLQQTGTPGGVRLALGVKHKPWAGSVGVNNRGSAYLGRTQIEATLLLNGLLRQGDQTRLTVAFPTELERFRYISLGRTDPLGSNGATLNLSVGHLVTKPKIAGASLAGKATTAGAQVSYPLIRSDQRNLFLTGGLDGLNSDNALFGQLISSEHTRVLRVAAAYSDAAPRRARSLSATLSRGVDGLGARIADPLVDAAFTKLNAQAGYQQQVGKQAVLRLAASAQYSGDRLPASEQFTFGGAQFGRAYASAVAVGDTGYAGSVEIAWRPANGLPKALAGSEVYGFADAGRVSMKRNAVFAGRDYDLSSAGAGVRVAMVGKAVLELEAAKALENPISRSKPWRLMLSMRSTI